MALFALVIQLGLPLAHFCGLDSEHHSHGALQACCALATDLPPGQVSLQKANPLPSGSGHDHATCPICQSMQRLGAVELSTSQVWTGPRLTSAKNHPFHRACNFQEPEWSSSSPRGPPRIL
jgi:hypothetical protein